MLTDILPRVNATSTKYPLSGSVRGTNCLDVQHSSISSIDPVSGKLARGVGSGRLDVVGEDRQSRSKLLSRRSVMDEGTKIQCWQNGHEIVGGLVDADEVPSSSLGKGLE